MHGGEHEAGGPCASDELGSPRRGDDERLLAQAVPAALERDLDDVAVPERRGADREAVDVGRPGLVERGRRVRNRVAACDLRGPLRLRVDDADDADARIAGQRRQVALPCGPPRAGADDVEAQARLPGRTVERSGSRLVSSTGAPLGAGSARSVERMVSRPRKNELKTTWIPSPRMVTARATS